MKSIEAPFDMKMLCFYAKARLRIIMAYKKLYRHPLHNNMHRGRIQKSVVCKSVSYERIEPSPRDEKFRKAVKEAIDSGINEIVVIAGELGSYGFPELKQSAVQALSRGVRVRVYATEAAPADVVNEIRELGGDIYIGKVRVKDHYLVIDRNTFIISEKEEVGQPSKIGTRKARLYKNNPKDAKRIIAFFNDLIRSDFISRAKEKSRIMKIVDVIFSAFIPNYMKTPAEPDV